MMSICLRYWILGAAFLLEDELPDKGVTSVSVPLKNQYSLLITEPIPFLSAKILSMLMLIPLYAHCTDGLAPHFKASFMLTEASTFYLLISSFSFHQSIFKRVVIEKCESTSVYCMCSKFHR